MGSILKVRLPNGSIVEVPAIVGPPGKDGKDGVNGTPGYTPAKGVDYYTEADKAEMVGAVLAALPNGDEVSY